MTDMVRRFRRLCAALVLLGAIGTGATVPVLDALLHHRGAAEPLRAHVDRPGGCHSHAEHCLLRGPEAGPRLQADAASVANAYWRRAWSPPPAPLRAVGRRSTSLHRSRAPPATLV
jgi:hypothetical protein